MALSQTYADFATGNDYKGASFVDGAYTSATKTLVKAGAFAATKVNHWLYLESNDGGSIVAGYYKVATVPDANTVTLDTDAGAGVDDDAAKCTQAAGTTALPWRSVQGALDLITRDATNGDQVNVKAGTAEVLTAALTLATYGSPSVAAPLVLRGYTSAANDGGVGVLDGNNGNFTIIAGRRADIALIDLRLTNVGGASVLELGARNIVYNCQVDTTAVGAPTAISSNAGCVVAHCYLHDVPRGIQTGYGGAMYAYNYIVPSGTTQYGILNNGTSGDVYIGNVILCSHTGAYGYFANNANTGHTFLNNVFYNTTAGTVPGIFLNDNAAGVGQTVLNNIIVGWSGAGGIGIKHDGRPGVVGYNAFYNNATAETYALEPLADLGGDVTLAADPFTNAATGDFSLTAAAKLALADKGFPGQYLGAHANTDSHLNIGPIQLAAVAASGGGFPKIASLLGRTRM